MTVVVFDKNTTHFYFLVDTYSVPIIYEVDLFEQQAVILILGVFLHYLVVAVQFLEYPSPLLVHHYLLQKLLLYIFLLYSYQIGIDHLILAFLPLQEGIASVGSHKMEGGGDLPEQPFWVDRLTLADILPLYFIPEQLSQLLGNVLQLYKKVQQLQFVT